METIWDSPAALPVTESEAAAAVAEHFGVVGTAKALGSNQDSNVLIRTEDGERYIFKVANPGTEAAALKFQNAALHHLTNAGLATPLPIAACDGSETVRLEFASGQGTARLLTYVPGALFSEAAHPSALALTKFGTLIARVSVALADFEHPDSQRRLLYDNQNAADVVAALAANIPDLEQRHLVLEVSHRAWEHLAPLTSQLRTQIVHGDLADYNVVGAVDEAGRLMPRGVIDFGDVMESWLVGDLATAIASLLAHDGRDYLTDAVAVVAGFHRITPLNEAELSALWPLVCARACVLATGVETVLTADPSNTYAAEERELDWAIVRRANRISYDLAEAALRHALDLSSSAVAIAAAAWVPDCTMLVAPTGQWPPVDLSVLSWSLTSGDWLSPSTHRHAVADQLADGWGLAGAGPRLAATEPDQASPAPTVQLGVDAFAPAGAQVVSPMAAVVAHVEGSCVMLRGAEVDVWAEGVTCLREIGEHLAPGDHVGHVASAGQESALPSHVHARVSPRGVLTSRLVPAAHAAAWQALCGDSAALVGAPAAAESRSVPPVVASRLVQRRYRSVAAAQEHYFSSPPQIERGWRHHLIDTAGRTYLDMVNNVAVLGHSHPAVTAAAAAQFSLLNTNSRFSYEAMVAYAERIIGLLPDPLDTVFFVNSGSEAVDLALRIARTATGRRDTICLAGGYHGWTTATDEISTSLNDNPNSRDTRPPWVHLAPMPNLYRGEHRGEDAAEAYTGAVRNIVSSLETGPGVFIAEPMSGNAGGVELPPGYLSAVYTAVRASGGLTISDEVQLGYGRSGSHFWGFQMHDVVPDIVTMAKAAGNGHPIGFVVTRREIADAFGSEGSFFSSVGGSPVSARVGLAVLDTLAAEDLQGNAARVGAHLHQRLTDLADQHALIGHVHGRGLYLGIELVNDLNTRAPATAAAQAICERLLRLGVIDHATGDHSNVLKVKPPLCITQASADFFVDQLHEVLAHGW